MKYLVLITIILTIINIPLTIKNIYARDTKANTNSSLYKQISQDVRTRDNKLPQAKEVTIETLTFNIAGEEGQRIAWCESRYHLLAENPNSTAKGIMQFIDGTWEAYCEGDVFDPVANLRCFKKLYKDHPDWWECA